MRVLAALVLMQIHRRAIHAITQAGWLWAVLEHMPEMGMAGAANHLRTAAEQAAIIAVGNSFLADRREKARPAGT